MCIHFNHSEYMESLIIHIYSAVATVWLPLWICDGCNTRLCMRSMALNFHACRQNCIWCAHTHTHKHPKSVNFLSFLALNFHFTQSHLWFFLCNRLSYFPTLLLRYSLSSFFPWPEQSCTSFTAAATTNRSTAKRTIHVTGKKSNVCTQKNPSLDVANWSELFKCIVRFGCAATSNNSLSDRLLVPILIMIIIIIMLPLQILRVEYLYSIMIRITANASVSVFVCVRKYSARERQKYGSPGA